MNNQHPTTNIQHAALTHAQRFIGCSMLDVGGCLFLLFVSSSFSLRAETATNALPPLSPAYPPMPPSFWDQHGPAILIGSCIFLALAAIVLWMIFKSKPRPVLPPEAVAREALARLLGQPEDGKVLSEVSQILRRYVAAAFAWPPGEMTTVEFCAALNGNEKIGAQLAQVISDFLRGCDERKFSRPVGVQASACSANAPKTPATLKRELQPATARALELVNLAEHQRLKSTTPTT